MNNKGNYKQKIVEDLLELGIPANLKGFIYLKDILIYLINNDIKDVRLKNDIYKIIANTYNTSEYRVERDIRYSIEIGYVRTKANINDELFRNSINYDKLKPTNKQFIMTVLNSVIQLNLTSLFVNIILKL